MLLASFFCPPLRSPQGSVAPWQDAVIFFFSLAVGWGEYVLSPSYGKKAVGKAAFPGQEDKQGAGVSGMEKPWLHPWASPSHSTERGPGGCRAHPDTPNTFPRAVVWGSQHPAWPHSPSLGPGCPPALTPTRSVAALCSVGLGKALKGGVPGGACPSPPLIWGLGLFVVEPQGVPVLPSWAERGGRG